MAREKSDDKHDERDDQHKPEELGDEQATTDSESYQQ